MSTLLSSVQRDLRYRHVAIQIHYMEALQNTPPPPPPPPFDGIFTHTFFVCFFFVGGGRGGGYTLGWFSPVGNASFSGEGSCVTVARPKARLFSNRWALHGLTNKFLMLVMFSQIFARAASQIFARAAPPTQQSVWCCCAGFHPDVTCKADMAL